MAQRIASEGLKFVVACAKMPDVALAPSRVVDEGWHALIVHTKAYEELCASLGDFVHHCPGYDPDNYDPLNLVRTQDAIRIAGYDVDEELWGSPTGEAPADGAFSCLRTPDVPAAGDCRPSDPGERQGPLSVDDQPPLRHEGGEMRSDFVAQFLGKVVIRGRIAGPKPVSDVVDEGLFLGRDVEFHGVTVRKQAR
ncbi:hypothetical protein AB0F24_18215 [Streptomyces platensis]|uniref:hypothetical protein n=1 Tax=Streptomyces platensis TaxID=58346 RepID=UPI00340CD02D